MIHKFTTNGLFLVLDVYSGALHRLDPLAYDLLDYGPAFDRDAVHADLCLRYPEKDLREAMEELTVLTQQQMLYTVWDGEVPSMAGPPVIKAMCLHAAHDCNMRCRYCFAATGTFHGARSMLSADTGCRALAFLADHSGSRRNLEVDFFGGEPLMNLETIREVVSYGRRLEQQIRKRFKFTITTNGLLLDEETIGYLNQEFDNVVVSVDGRGPVHDRMRKTLTGRGSYGAILPQTQRLADSRGQSGYYVRGTFTAYNLDFDLDVLSLADAGFRQISVEPVVAPLEAPYALTEEHLPEIYAAYDRLMEEYLRRLQEGRGFEFFHFNVDLSQGPCAAKRTLGCGAGSEYVAVTPEGDIYPCHQFVGVSEYKMGSVLTGAFDSGMQGVFRGNTVFAKEACSVCWAKFYCSGGCPANGHHHAGSIREPYTLGCAMEKKRLECALAIAAIKMEETDALYAEKL